MRQSVLRFVSALLLTAVATSLLVGGVSGESPVPEQPPGIPRVPSGLYDAGTKVTVSVTYPDAALPPQTRAWNLAPGASTASVQASINNLLADSESGCSTVKVTQKIGGLGGHASATFYSQTWWCWNSRTITNDPTLSAWGESSNTVEFKGVMLKQITRGGRGQSYADDRAEGKFCGIGCGTAWITKTVDANGRLTTWNSGVK